jgi:PadR family transcriptional regulator, regulatory protein PadR
MEPLSRVTPATLDVLDAVLDAGAPVWGLRLVKATGRPAGSVYPILERLERAGWVESTWDDDADRSGPRRRLYRPTADGAVEARALLAARRVAPVVRARTVQP